MKLTPQTMVEEMRQLAEENERSLAAEVRLAVRQYLERHRQEAQEEKESS